MQETTAAAAIATRNEADLAVASLPADRHPAVVYLSRLGSEHSRRAMRNALRRVLALLPEGAPDDPLAFAWHRLSYAHVAAIRARLLESGAKPATINQTLAAVRGVLREAWRLGLVADEDYHRAADVRDIKAEQLPAGRVAGHGELVALFTACKADPSPAGARDAALLAVLFGCGLRRSEAVALDLADVDPDGRLRVRVGKGRKERELYLANGSLAAVRRWLEVRGNQAGALFVRIGKGDRLTSERLTTQAARYILADRGVGAGVTLRPHDARRTFITALLDNGVDVLTVQRLAGHANPATTSRYDRRGDEAKRRAVETLAIPF
jgi:integrase